MTRRASAGIRCPAGRPSLASRGVTDAPVEQLLDAASRGDQAAWDELVDRYSRLVWSVVRGFRLDDATAHDVFQTVWLRLVEHVGRIREPERLPGWLSMTARNECIRMLKRQRRQIPSDFEFDVPDPTVRDAADPVIENELVGAALEAFSQLSADHQRLLRLLCTDPPLDYETIAAIIGRPVGSIGPTRARCLEKLRAILSHGEQS